MHFQTSKRGVPSAGTWITVLFVASLAVTRPEGIPGVRHFPVCRLSRYEPFREFGMSPKAGTARHITQEQAKQQASRALGPLNQLGQLSVEADPRDPAAHFWHYVYNPDSHL
jgi:hypothetical protein